MPNHKGGVLFFFTTLPVLFALIGCITQYSASGNRLSYAELDGESRGNFKAAVAYQYLIHPDFWVISSFRRDLGPSKGKIGGKPWVKLDKVIEPELSRMGGNGIRNLQINYGYTFSDYLITLFVPLVGSGTLILEGEAVEIK